MTREELLGKLIDWIIKINRPHPVRVAIDGVDAAGKTTLADELADLVQSNGHPAIRASLDGFHRPQVERYRLGKDSAEGYYADSFDYPALREALLKPLGPGGDRLYRTAVFDFHNDSPVYEPACLAAPDAILLLDGVFLLRPELNSVWDFRIFLEVDFSIVMERVMQRDLALFGSTGRIQSRYRQRYIPAQQFYLKTVRPQDPADVVVDHNEPASPKIIKGPLSGHFL